MGSNASLLSSSQMRWFGNYSGNEAFGAIDEYAAYPAALSLAQIQSHYNSINDIKQCQFKLHPDKWSHVSGVYDSSSNLMKVYINSEEVCSVSIIGAPAGLAGSSENLYIGRRSIDSIQSYSGKIASLRFYSVTDDTIPKTNYDATKRYVC